MEEVTFLEWCEYEDWARERRDDYAGKLVDLQLTPEFTVGYTPSANGPGFDVNLYRSEDTQVTGTD